MRIKPMFAWYDLWVGAFVDLPKARVYVFPIPTLGLCIEWRRTCHACSEAFYAEDLFDYCGLDHCARCKAKEEYFDSNYS